MAADFVSALSALAGVLVGGLVNYVATRSAKDREWRLAIDKELLLLRNRTYVEYLDELDNQVSRMIKEDFPTPDERLRLRSKVNSMTFCAGAEPVLIADRLRKALHHSTADEQLSVFELRDAFLKAATIDLQLLGRDLPRAKSAA